MSTQKKATKATSESEVVSSYPTTIPTESFTLLEEVATTGMWFERRREVAEALWMLQGATYHICMNTDALPENMNYRPLNDKLYRIRDLLFKAQSSLRVTGVAPNRNHRPASVEEQDQARVLEVIVKTTLEQFAFLRRTVIMRMNDQEATRLKEQIRAQEEATRREAATRG